MTVPQRHGEAALGATSIAGLDALVTDFLTDSDGEEVSDAEDDET